MDPRNPSVLGEGCCAVDRCLCCHAGLMSCCHAGQLPCLLSIHAASVLRCRREALDAAGVPFPAPAEAHLACAAAEAPLLPQADQQYFGAGLPAAAAALQGAGLLARHPLARGGGGGGGGALHYVGAVGNPASKIRCAAVGWGRPHVGSCAIRARAGAVGAAVSSSACGER